MHSQTDVGGTEEEGSHTLRSQLALSNRLEGFKSRWTTVQVRNQYGSPQPVTGRTLGAMKSLEGSTSLQETNQLRSFLLSCFAYLIDKVLTVVIAQVLRSNHSVQIRFHQFLNKVHLLEVLVGRGLHDVENVDDLGAMAG
jgi:hypothetical protein